MSMEQNGNQNMSAPTFCRNGCGFYAAQAFDGMCSKCYKDLKELQRSSEATVTNVHTPASLAAAATVSAVASASSSMVGVGVNNNSSNNSSSVGGSSSSSRSSLVAAALDANKKTEVDVVTSSLSRTSLGELNKNSSSSSGSKDKLTEKLAGTSGGAVGGGSSGMSEVETGSPTVATAKASDKGDDAMEGCSNDADAASNDGDKGKKAKRNRCMECRKKVGLTGFECHCGKVFCSLHRYSDTHDCTFDFKEKGQQEIRKNNPVIKGEKVQKI